MWAALARFLPIIVSGAGVVLSNLKDVKLSPETKKMLMWGGLATGAYLMFRKSPEDLAKEAQTKVINYTEKYSGKDPNFDAAVLIHDAVDGAGTNMDILKKGVEMMTSFAKMSQHYAQLFKRRSAWGWQSDEPANVDEDVRDDLSGNDLLWWTQSKQQKP